MVQVFSGGLKSYLRYARLVGRVSSLWRSKNYAGSNRKIATLRFGTGRTLSSTQTPGAHKGPTISQTIGSLARAAGVSFASPIRSLNFRWPLNPMGRIESAAFGARKYRAPVIDSEPNSTARALLVGGEPETACGERHQFPAHVLTDRFPGKSDGGSERRRGDEFSHMDPVSRPFDNDLAALGGLRSHFLENVLSWRRSRFHDGQRRRQAIPQLTGLPD